jgi:archaetidylinositol phosphate synthase
METVVFVDAEREQSSLLAKAERRALDWLVQRIPSKVDSDHLTLMGFLALFLAGVFYYFSKANPVFLHLVNVCLTINWFGDSLDGTLARYRHKQRPRYGFYVDHIIDTFGTLFLFTGLALSGYMSKEVAFAALLVYFMLAINVYLATYTLGKFKLSFGKLSPTELRMLLGIGNIALLYHPRIHLLGQRYLLYDVGGMISIGVMSCVLIASTIRNTKTLYELEPISACPKEPARQGGGGYPN